MPVNRIDFNAKNTRTISKDNRLTHSKKINNKKPKIKMLKKKLGDIDLAFLLIVSILVVFGLVMVFSASYVSAYNKTGDSLFYIKKQFVFAVIGFVLMLLISKIPYGLYKKHSMTFYGVALFLMVIVVIMNKGKAGRWLTLGPLSLQPSEFMKIALIIMTATIITNNQNKMDKFKYGMVAPLIPLVPVVIVLMLFQHHLSATIIMSSIVVIMIFIGGAKLLHFIPMAVAGIAGVSSIILIKGISYMAKRFEIWFNPFSDPSGNSYQTIQSLYAIASGGVMGLGIGNSRQKYLYLPEPHNDFIFAIVCEELGLIGALLVILLFVFLVYRGFVIANKAPNKFASLLVIGITLQIALQALMNIAVVSNSMPNTGISLPFFSYGGTALVLQLAEMGIILNISRYSSEEKP